MRVSRCYYITFYYILLYYILLYYIILYYFIYVYMYICIYVYIYIMLLSLLTGMMMEKNLRVVLINSQWPYDQIMLKTTTIGTIIDILSSHWEMASSQESHIMVSYNNCYYSPNWYEYGSIPLNTIFKGMNIHLPAILMFTRGTRFWHTAIS